MTDQNKANREVVEALRQLADAIEAGEVDAVSYEIEHFFTEWPGRQMMHFSHTGAKAHTFVLARPKIRISDLT